MKTVLTQKFENAIQYHFDKTGYFIAFEVQFGFHQKGDGKQYADAAIYNTNKELTCFEIKVTKSDFYSKAKKTFFGHKNYYAMPLELYEQVKDEIPEEIGVYSFNQYGWFECVKKAKKVECKFDENTILWSIIRSRTNSSSISVKYRTNETKEYLDALYDHLEFVDDKEKVVKLDEIEKYIGRFDKDKEYFASIFVSSEQYDFYSIYQFKKNYQREYKKVSKEE